MEREEFIKQLEKKRESIQKDLVKIEVNLVNYGYYQTLLDIEERLYVLIEQLKQEMRGKTNGK